MYYAGRFAVPDEKFLEENCNAFRLAVLGGSNSQVLPHPVMSVPLPNSNSELQSSKPPSNEMVNGCVNTHVKYLTKQVPTAQLIKKPSDAIEKPEKAFAKSSPAKIHQPKKIVAAAIAPKLMTDFENVTSSVTYQAFSTLDVVNLYSNPTTLLVLPLPVPVVNVSELQLPKTQKKGRPPNKSTRLRAMDPANCKKIAPKPKVSAFPTPISNFIPNYIEKTENSSHPSNFMTNFQTSQMPINRNCRPVSINRRKNLLSKIQIQRPSQPGRPMSNFIPIHPNPAPDIQIVTKEENDIKVQYEDVEMNDPQKDADMSQQFQRFLQSHSYIDGDSMSK